MPNATLTERRKVAKKKTASDQPPGDQPFGRIELQAPPEWIEQLDAMAKAMGLSRSAYIRQACNRQMASDRRQLGPNAPNHE